MDRIGQPTIRREVERGIPVFIDGRFVVWVASLLPDKLLVLAVIAHGARPRGLGDGLLTPKLSRHQAHLPPVHTP